MRWQHDRKEEKSELLYDLLFKQKVDKLGDLNIEHHYEYVVVDKASSTNQKQHWLVVDQFDSS